MIGFYSPPVVDWTPDVVSQNWGTVGIQHDFAPYTGRIVHMRYNGIQSALYLNKVDGLYYGTCYLVDGESVQIDVTDPNTSQLLRVTSSSYAAPTEHTPVRVRYVAPGGSGSTYSEAVPGALEVAMSSGELTTGDHIILKDGTYYLGEMVVNVAAQNVVIKADTGATPVLSGFRTGSWPAWVETVPGVVWQMASGQFSPNTKNLYQTVSGVRRLMVWYDSLAQLNAVTHGWTIDGLFLYVKGWDPNSNHVDVGQHYDGESNDEETIRIDGDGCQISGIVFEGYCAAPGTLEKVIDVSADDVWIHDCVFRDCQGPAIDADDRTRLLVEDCTLRNNGDLLTELDVKMQDNPLPPTTTDRDPRYRSENRTQVNISGMSSTTFRNCTMEGLADSIRIQGATGANYDVNFKNITITDSQTSPYDINATHQQIRFWLTGNQNTHNAVSMALAQGGPYIHFDEDFDIYGWISDEEVTQMTNPTKAGFKFNATDSGVVGQLMMVNCTLRNAFGDDSTINRMTAFVGRDFEQGDCLLYNCILESWDWAWDDTEGGEIDIGTPGEPVRNLIYTSSLSTAYRWTDPDSDLTVFASSGTFASLTGCSTSNPNLQANGKPSPAISGAYVHGYTHNPKLGSPPAELGFHNAPTP